MPSLRASPRSRARRAVYAAAAPTMHVLTRSMSHSARRRATTGRGPLHAHPGNRARRGRDCVARRTRVSALPQATCPTNVEDSASQSTRARSSQPPLPRSRHSVRVGSKQPVAKEGMTVELKAGPADAVAPQAHATPASQACSDAGELRLSARPTAREGARGVQTPWG